MATRVSGTPPTGNAVVKTDTLTPIWSSWINDFYSNTQDTDATQSAAIATNAANIATQTAIDVVQTANIATLLAYKDRVQVAYIQTGAVATGLTGIPFDDTIPQITEGDQYLSVTLTPTSASNLLHVQVKAELSNSVLSNMAIALFQDSTANALCVAGTFMSTAQGNVGLYISHILVAGTTSATTFKIRAGGDSASTITFNGIGGARKYGSALNSSMIVTEYKV